MIALVLRCPHCRREQKYVNYLVRRRDEIFGKRRACVWCGKRFTIKSAKQDNIVREICFFGRG
ncbi:MAG: hypothetical protein DRP12_00010 [Candidatus Aenigmatarchaeota archaeon]|nr:MAG: hypothetical protein DRP12_00010 [Candidatus Aenigmarchaeota archaeon]